MSEDTKVLYNAACPVCRREIEHYQEISQREALPIRYHDLGDPQHLAEWGIDPDTAARRLHVAKDGQIYGGIPAFVVLWQDIPRLRWLARLVSLPGIFWAANAVYDHVLAPALYRWHLRRLRRESSDR